MSCRFIITIRPNFGSKHFAFLLHCQSNHIVELCANILQYVVSIGNSIGMLECGSVVAVVR